MTKSKTPEVKDIQSIKDAAYRQAVSTGAAQSSLEQTARYVLEKFPKVLTEKSDELNAELREGYLIRCDEITPKREYALVDGNYINVSELAKRPNATEVLSVAYATSMSNYDYRKIDNPEKKKIVGGIRADASTYVSNRISDLRKKLIELTTPKKETGKRAANKTLREHWEANFVKDDAKVTKAKALGDPDANPVKFRMAVEAFWAVINK
jgi:hypothetical protein